MQPEVAQWRYKLQAALVLAVGILGLGAGALLVYFDFRNSGQLRDYRSAGACQAASDALTTDTCKYSGSATVAGTSGQAALSVDLKFDSLPDHTFQVSFPTDREPDSSSLNTGASAPAVLWNGEVTEFAGVSSAENPNYLPQNLALAGWIIVVFGLGVGALSAPLVRRAWSV
ncbi:MAG TPA: hypothetical protein VFL29_11540 [Candidatus Dormibacteraeota bacterium]|nr:hypothetical protein [Candidatus Dormibacteraeota bacterium]